MLSAPRPVGVSVWVRKNSKQVIGQKKCEKSPEILRFQDFSVMRDQFRYTLEIGKIES
jgi:hypothetical protein